MGALRYCYTVLLAGIRIPNKSYINRIPKHMSTYIRRAHRRILRTCNPSQIKYRDSGSTYLWVDRMTGGPGEASRRARSPGVVEQPTLIRRRAKRQGEWARQEVQLRQNPSRRPRNCRTNRGYPGITAYLQVVHSERGRTPPPIANPKDAPRISTPDGTLGPMGVLESQRPGFGVPHRADAPKRQGSPARTWPHGSPGRMCPPKPRNSRYTRQTLPDKRGGLQIRQGKFQNCQAEPSRG